MTQIMPPAQESDMIVPAEVEAAEAAKAKAAAESGKTVVTDVDDADLTPEQREQKKVDTKKAREAFMARKTQRKSDEMSAQLAQLQRELAEARAAPKAKASGDLEAPKRPNPKDFELQRWDPKYEEAMAEYQDAHEDYVSKKAEKVARDTASSAQREAVEARNNAALANRAENIGKKGVDKYEDFEQTVQDAFEAMPPAPEALRKLVHLENAEDVFYHLAMHPEVLERITAMEPMGQALEFGQISARLAASSKVASKVTKAQPTPTQPRGTDGKFSKEEDSRYERMLKGSQDRW